MVEKGDKIKIISDNYEEKYRKKTWTVTHVAYSREEHRGYDECVGGPLIDCRGLPFSLYQFEFEIVG